MTTDLFEKRGRDPNGHAAWSSELGKLWPNSSLSQQAFRDNEYSSFIAYVNQEALRLQKHQSRFVPLPDGTIHIIQNLTSTCRFASGTIEDTINMIHRLRCDFDRSQSDVLEGMRNLFRDVDDAALAQTLKLAVRVWLTIDVRLEFANHTTAHADANTLEWPAQMSLHDVIQSQFAPSESDEWYEDASRNHSTPA